MPGTNNFLEWDSALSNIEADATYATDSTRINGVPSGVGGSGILAASILHNKLYRQTSVMAAALAAFGAAQGQNMSDASLVNLTTALEAFLATLNSPNFTGSPTAPTTTSGLSNNQIATTAFVHSLIKQFSISSGFVVNGPSGTVSGLTLNSPIGYGINGSFRFSGGVRCTANPTNTPIIEIVLGSTVLASFGLHFTGDFVRFSVEIGVPSTTNTASYSRAEGLSSAAASVFYETVVLTVAQVTAAFTLGLQLAGGNGTGSFIFDFLTLEVIQ